MVYKWKSKEVEVPVHHWAVPQAIWNEIEGKKHNKDRQTMLEGKFPKQMGLQGFTHDGSLHVVAQFITCDNQVGPHNVELPDPLSDEKGCQSLAVADKVMFHNCLVAMRPKSTQKDLPSTHDVSMYNHNKFVCTLEELKHDIIVSQMQRQYDKNLTNHVGCT